MTNHTLNNLIEHYSPDALIQFLRNKSRNFHLDRETLISQEGEGFAEGERIGEIRFENQVDRLLICRFEVNKPLSERSGKKAQYEKAKSILKQDRADAGIFVFNDPEGNFRFSLIYENPVGTRAKWSDFRRFTYFVSPELTNKTFIQQIGDSEFSSLEIVKDAFSVEKVTNRFFVEFRERFDQTKKEFETTNQNTVCAWLRSKYSTEEYQEQIRKFTFTFLGRIIFLYFLLRKGWIEDKKDYIRKIVEDENQHNLYLDIFKPLFFDVFAKEINQRPNHLQKQYQNTPYLNGGLFEHSDLERELEKEGKFILFSDEFIRKIILNYFEVYNFTIDENSPDDQEVSIDPEMLGKVFENTLAEEERGQKGTFYTPREIVHFMVKDSLVQYLFNETKIEKPILQKLIFGSDVEIEGLNANQIRLIDSKLESVKILDPAVGSGAFPVEMMQVLIELRKRLNVRVGRNINEVSLKKQLIKNNLYGVDIDPGAIEIAKLRLWLALIVDYDKSLAEPLPNLDFQFRVGNSLQEKIDDIDIFNEQNSLQMDWINGNSSIETKKAEMIRIKDEFYLVNDEGKRHQLKAKFDILEHEIIQDVLKRYHKQFEEQLHNQNLRGSSKKLGEIGRKIESLQQKIKDGTYKLFKPDFHFSEVFDRKDDHGNRVGGFDIVIGNPPYGIKVDNDIRDRHELGSRDSYGIFIATSFPRFLRSKGVLEFIVSDTWLTIKTHKELRSQVLEKQLHKVIQLHKDCFDATVNACVISVTNYRAPENHEIIAADLTNISTRQEITLLHEKLYNLEKYIGESTPIYAVYSYNQSLITINSNIPIFIGSPKLFRLMQDIDISTTSREIDGRLVDVRRIGINGKTIDLVRFGDIADVNQGLATGDNKAYLFQNPDAWGRYRNINEYRDFLLTESDLEEIEKDEERRKKIIEFGIHKSQDESDFDQDRWFGGRYIVPYDKGGESDAESGWLPNYYVPTNYFIDWSTWAVKRMRSLTIADRIRINHENKVVKPNYRHQIAAVFRNVDFYFTSGITYSITGIYAPTFRVGSNGVFDVKGSFIHPSLGVNHTLGILASKLIKYLAKVFIYNCVDMQVDAIKEIPALISEDETISTLVTEIIRKQRQDSRYKFSQNEQKKIDQLVYELFGLNEEDIIEVNTWYERRYPNLRISDNS